MIGILPLLLVLVVVCWRLALLIGAKLANERRIYIQATGVEAYAFAASMHPDSGRAEKLEGAVVYMRRQFEQRHIPFDYEQARAVIEQAALELARE